MFLIFKDVLIRLKGGYIRKANRPKSYLMRLYYQSQDSFVVGDEGRISQAVYNLLDNALKFSKEGSIITVNTKLENNKIIVSVKDTGCIGIIGLIGSQCNVMKVIRGAAFILPP